MQCIGASDRVEGTEALDNREALQACACFLCWPSHTNYTNDILFTILECATTNAREVESAQHYGAQALIHLLRWVTELTRLNEEALM